MRFTGKKGNWSADLDRIKVGFNGHSYTYHELAPKPRTVMHGTLGHALAEVAQRGGSPEDCAEILRKVASLDKAARVAALKAELEATKDAAPKAEPEDAE